MIRWTLFRRAACLVACALSLTACDALDSPQDAKAKENLVGSWYYEYQDASESTVKSVLTLTDDGKFIGRQRVGDAPQEIRSSGSWFVTDQLFKVQIVEIDGKQLGRADMLFMTCKMQDMTSRDFVCTQVQGWRVTFRRVLSDFALI
jgi:hypothetical protein